MAVQKSKCESCQSDDNLATFDNGSTFCFTPDCDYNKTKKTIVDDTPKDLVQGQHTPLANRRISQRTCEFFSYQVGMASPGHISLNPYIPMPEEPCHIANYRDSSGKIVAQKIRFEGKRFQWRGEPNKASLFGKHLWSNNSNNIIITEGEIDALSIAEAQDCKWPVVSIPNGAQSASKTIKSELEWLSGFKQIILCFDSDEAGQKAVEDVVGLFPPGKIRIANLSGKDANEVLVAGKTIELTKLVWNATEYRPDNVIGMSEVSLDELFEPEPKGLELPFPILNEMIRGLKKHRIYTVYAGTGAGKTSIMKEIAYHIRRTRPEITIANVFLEESFKHSVKSYIALDNNTPTYVIEENPDALTKSQKQESYDRLKGEGDDKFLFYKHFGSLDSKRLFNMLEYFVVGKGAEIVILDHLSILISGLDSTTEGERVVIDRTMTALRSFTERTGCVILLATQLKRVEGSYNTGAEIHESSARGSGAVEHLSDVIFSLNRDVNSENPNDALIKVIKNRVSGSIGEADLLEYNSRTGRYLPKKKSLKLPEKYKHLEEDQEDDGLLE